jgi:hypothetical protein
MPLSVSARSILLNSSAKRAHLIALQKLRILDGEEIAARLGITLFIFHGFTFPLCGVLPGSS